MLKNPFTPTQIASLPEDFFGRRDEMRTLERSLMQGSVAIQGAIGIGKSSLLANALLRMEGFASGHSSRSVVAVADTDTDTVEKAARLLLHSLVEVDETQRKVRFKLGNVFERESAEISRNFVEGRHLEILKRLVEKEYLTHLLDKKNYLILAIDEADKSPMALARLIRSVLTHTQQHGIGCVRFLVAGVSPFFQGMVDEDAGIARFFYKTISLLPLAEVEATQLVEEKLGKLGRWANEAGLELRVDPSVVPRVVALSGGHPHLLQLLGSHLVEHEDQEPDGLVDSRDLANSLRRICYEDRARVYDSTLHNLELNFKLDAFKNVLEIAEEGFPTRIDRQEVAGIVNSRLVDSGDIQWLIEHNVFSVVSEEEYGLVDEFLRIRVLMDAEESPADVADLEERLISYSYYERLFE